MLNYCKHDLCEGLLLIFVSIMMEKVAHVKARVQKPYPIYDQNGQNQLKSTPYLCPKGLKNHTLWGRTYLYSPYKGVPPGVWCNTEVIRATLPSHGNVRTNRYVNVDYLLMIFVNYKSKRCQLTCIHFTSTVIFRLTNNSYVPYTCIKRIFLALLNQPACTATWSIGSEVRALTRRYL